MESDRVQFDSRIQNIGGSYYMRIPPEVADYLNLRSKKNIKLQTEAGKHGRYLSAWNPDQQGNDEFKKDAELKDEE